MISVEEALNIVLKQARPSEVTEVALQDAVGRVLAEEVFADRDFPPFDRVTMDGIAIHYERYAQGQKTFFVECIAPAGAPQQTLKDKQHCIEVMTGAILPKGTDTVIRYEDLVQEGDHYLVQEKITARRNIHSKGEDLLKGNSLMEIGARIKAIDINVLATVGKSLVKVYRLPKVAVISSGDELVPVDQVPKEYQIRRSNVFMIAARLKELSIEADCFHLMDSKEEIKARIAELDQAYDVLILSGGVSKGKYDYIPEVLNNLGFEKLFHRVAQRPGKPFWFGVNPQTTVFAFPGNPISTLMCLHKYFIPWLNRKHGQTDDIIKVRLEAEYNFKPDLTRFALSALRQLDDGSFSAQIAKGNGSGDIVQPLLMDGFLTLPRGKDLYKSGEIFDFIPFYPIYR